MRADERIEKSFAVLADEVRREPVPELDWARVETSLLARVAAEPRVSERTRPRLGMALSLAALALAAVVGVVGVLHHEGPASSRAVARDATSLPADTSTNVNGDTLALGAPVTASAEPLVVSHRGHATWTLAPNSEAHLESVGDVITVALDRGVLSAHVVKSPRPESFVVRVDRTRIAVHGTAFRVERLATTVHIAVSEGVVAVGPIDKTAFELIAPASATVTLDGVRTDLAATSSPPTAPVATSRTPESATAAAAPGKAKAPATDTTRVTGAGVDRVVASVQECFGEHTVSRGDLRVTVLTRMSLNVQASGRIGTAEFDPPLVSAVRSCVDQAVAQIRLAPSEGGFSVERVLELER